MGTRQLSFKLPLKPFLGFVALAGRTMAVSTGPKDPVIIMALFTLVKREPIVGSSAVDYCVDDFSVVLRHGIHKEVKILRAVCAKDIGNCLHVIGPPSQS